MASEPSEEAVANFVSFTSTTREQAISFLKANGNDSQKAINAYFEDPTGPQTKTCAYFNDSSIPSFDFHQQDNAPRVPATAPPSRPPSRVNMQDATQGAGFQGPTESATQGSAGNGQGLSLAEREEHELQQAVAMSLNQGMSEQETGVTTASQPHFHKATQDHYDEGAWAMTLFNTSSQEVVISPDPEDRKRVEDEPAFIRPTEDNLYLGGFLTILHSIPLAREALLLRNKTLFDYGHDPQWWDGHPINLPKIVTVHEATAGDSDWDDIIHEAQRLMAFLDSTKRAFGSCGALANLKSMFSVSSDSEEIVTRFLEAWHGTALRADPGNQLKPIFSSLAHQEPSEEYEEPQSKEMFTLEPCAQQDHGQTLYDVLDHALWSDNAGEQLTDAWLEYVGDVLVMKVDAAYNANSVDVKIPAVFYPDRYLKDYREIAREFRTKRLQIYEDVSKVEQLIDRYTTPRMKTGNLTVKEVLEKAAAALPLVLPRNAPSGVGENTISSEAASADAERLANELKAISTKIESKLKELEQRKQSAVDALRSYSKTLTEPSDSSNEPPFHKYTLRGVCTEPHVTYVLRRSTASGMGDAMDIDSEKDGAYQWWRISFSQEDGKTRQAEKRAAQGDNIASQRGDVVGYTARRVREIEVLRAAREEWRSVLLVYASEAAMSAQIEPAPPQLQGFVNRDNEAFAEECEQSAANPVVNNKPEDWWAQQGHPQHDMSRKKQPVNVFDYQVTEWDDEYEPKQEMQERAGSSLLGPGSATINVQPNVSARDSGCQPEDQDEKMTDHVEQHGLRWPH